MDIVAVSRLTQVVQQLLFCIDGYLAAVEDENRRHVAIFGRVRSLEGLCEGMPHLGDQVVERLPLIDDPFVFHLRCIVSNATQSMLFGEDEIPARIP